MRPYRWILGAAAGLVALLLVGAVALTQWVDPEVFKPRIVATLSRASGRPVALPGRLELDWFPWLALRTGAGSVGNPPGVAGPPLLAWREASFGARLLPLLRGELELDRVRLVGARLALQRGADGRDNWSGLGAGARGGDGASLRLAGLDLVDSQLQLRDATDGTDLLLDGLQLETGAYVAGSPEPVKMLVRFGLRSGGERRLGDARLETSVALPPGEALVLQVGRSTLAARGFAAGLAPAGVPFSLALPGATLEPDRGAWRADAVELAVGAARLALRGLAYEQPGEAPPTAAATFALAPTSLRELLTVVGIEPPVTTDPKVLARFATQGRLSLRDGVLRVEPFALTLDDTHFEGSVVRGGEPPTAEVALAGDTLDIDRYLEPEGTPGEPFHFPGEALRALRARGTVTLERARFDDIGFEGLRARLLLDEQGLRGDPAAATSAGTPAKSGAARGARR